MMLSLSPSARGAERRGRDKYFSTAVGVHGAEAHSIRRSNGSHATAG
jgi:hypothetical protein